MNLPPEAVRFAADQCRSRVELLNQFRRARYMATVEGPRPVVDRVELSARRADYVPQAIIRAARREISELAEVARQNGCDPRAVVLVGLRAARSEFRAQFDGRPQWLSRGYGLYPGPGELIDRRRREAAEHRNALEIVQAERTVERLKAEAEAEREVARQARRSKAAKIRRDRAARRLQLPKPDRLRDGERIGRPIHPTALVPGDVIFEPDPYGMLERNVFVRLNRVSWTTDRWRQKPFDHFRHCRLVRGEVIHVIRFTAKALIKETV